MNYGREVLRCLAKIQDLAFRAGPARCVECTALINVMLVHCETNPSSRQTEALAATLRAWREECGPQLPAAEFDRQLQRLVTLLFAVPPPRPNDDGPPATRYSLGPRAQEQLALLRADLGLSIVFLYRHFVEHLHFPLPYPDYRASLDDLADSASQSLHQRAGR
jgi:hypothetical protein